MMTAGRRSTSPHRHNRRTWCSSFSISPLFELALVLAHETGHRIGSTRLLKWSDVAIEAKTIRWRGENDKIGFEHVTWLTPAALQALEQARRERPVIGEAWVFGAPGDASQPVSRHLMRDWWQQGEALAKVPRSPGLEAAPSCVTLAAIRHHNSTPRPKIVGKRNPAQR
jgi:integrase